MYELELGHKVKPEKAEKTIGKMTQLHPGEDAWFYTKCNNMRPLTDGLVVTNARVLGLTGARISFELAYSAMDEVSADDSKGTLTVSGGSESMTFKAVPKEDLPRLVQLVEHGRSVPLPDSVRSSMDADVAEAARQQTIKDSQWADTKVVGGKLTSKASVAIDRLRHGDEQPWLILVSSGGAGVIVAFDDRLAVVKTGALTSFMAGSLGGERVATIYFRDITGIEYNAGMMSGVLEILTPSYSGTSNKDYWRGSNKGRNANSDDPWTLSNTLPISKAEYRAVEKEVNELRARISQSKQLVVNMPTATTRQDQSSLADEVAKLAGLRDSGVLTEDEFAVAKARLLASHA